MQRRAISALPHSRRIGGRLVARREVVVNAPTGGRQLYCEVLTAFGGILPANLRLKDGSRPHPHRAKLMIASPHYSALSRMIRSTGLPSTSMSGKYTSCDDGSTATTYALRARTDSPTLLMWRLDTSNSLTSLDSPATYSRARCESSAKISGSLAMEKFANEAPV